MPSSQAYTALITAAANAVDLPAAESGPSPALTLTCNGPKPLTMNKSSQQCPENTYFLGAAKNPQSNEPARKASTYFRASGKENMGCCRAQ